MRRFREAGQPQSDHDQRCRLVQTNGWIYYTNAPNVADQISYTLTDGRGGTNTGYININTSVALVTGQTTGITVPSGNTPIVSFSGIPGYD